MAGTPQQGTAKVRIEVDTEEALKQIKALFGVVGSGGGPSAPPGQPPAAARPPGGGAVPSAGGRGGGTGVGDVLQIVSALSLLKQAIQDIVGTAQHVKDSLVQEATDNRLGIREGSFRAGAVLRARAETSQQLGVAGAYMTDQQRRAVFERNLFFANKAADTTLAIERLTREDLRRAAGPVANAWVAGELGYQAYMRIKSLIPMMGR